MAKSNKRQAAVDAQSKFGNAATSAGIQTHIGKRAVAAEYRDAVSLQAGWNHTESVDLDTHFVGSEPNASRWDYGVGVRRARTELVFWIEPHPASSTGEVKRLVEKVKWLKEKLESREFKLLSDLTDETSNQGYSPFCWIHSGTLRIIPNSKEAKMLAQHGIKAPTRRLELPVK